MAAKKSGLGRGLDALFPEKTVHSKQEEKPVQKAVSADDEKEKETETAGGIYYTGDDFNGAHLCVVCRRYGESESA